MKLQKPLEMKQEMPRRTSGDKEYHANMDQEGQHRPGIIFGNCEKVEVLDFDYQAHLTRS